MKVPAVADKKLRPRLHDPLAATIVPLGQALNEKEKSLAFAPVIALTLVIVAGELEPLAIVTNAEEVFPTEANWNVTGFGFAASEVLPVPCKATVKGVPAAPVKGSERLPLSAPPVVGMKLISKKQLLPGVRTAVEQFSNAIV